jgi:hypothetical protein
VGETKECETAVPFPLTSLWFGKVQELRFLGVDFQPVFLKPRSQHFVYPLGIFLQLTQYYGIIRIAHHAGFAPHPGLYGGNKPVVQYLMQKKIAQQGRYYSKKPWNP